MRNVYVTNTRIGPFYIAKSEDGHFHVIYDGTSLGSYATPEQAADDVAGGHTFSTPSGIDTASLGIPADVVEWQPVQAT
jgi:hypothetical protein